MFKNLWKSRTVIFGAVIATLGVVEANAQIIPAEMRGYTITAIGIATVWLRLLTTLPISEK